MFIRAAPPSDQKPYRPPPGKLSIFSNIYNDPYYWFVFLKIKNCSLKLRSLTKSIVGFAVGVFVARHLSEELNSADVGF